VAATNGVITYHLPQPKPSESVPLIWDFKTWQHIRNFHPAFVITVGPLLLFDVLQPAAPTWYSIWPAGFWLPSGHRILHSHPDRQILT